MSTPLQELSDKINALPKPDNGNSRLVLIHIKALVAEALDKESKATTKAIDESLLALLGTVQVGWIETANDPPLEKQTVYFVHGGLVHMGIYHMDAGYFAALNGNFYQPEEVPYWMPRYIPKPPKHDV